MDQDIAIRVSHVSKTFKVYMDKGLNLKEKVLFRKRNRYEDRQVLRDISFEVKKGEAIGLIGENGCGKSTTLKLLSRIMYPDQGTVEMNGRVSALIELGAGFHPDMSGRENIYTNAAIFGLGKEEIDRRLQEIIDFSELGEYIDNPVRTYSSGMYMRLAFSVAINVDAEILLIDEILAVGDLAFQAKCFNKLREIKSKGTTIVIVTHALPSVEQMCERSIWIESGKIRMDGAPRDVHPFYMEFMANRTASRKQASSAAPNASSADLEKETDKTQKEEAPYKEEKKRWGSGEARMQKVSVLDSEGKPRLKFSPEEPIRIHIEYTANKVLEDAVIGLAIYRSDQTYIYGTNSLIDYSHTSELKENGRIDLCLDSFPVSNGSYLIDLALHRPDGFNYDFWKEICEIEISDPKNTPGLVHIPHRWEID